MCQRSILEKRIVLLYHNFHYQNITEYEIIDKGTNYEYDEELDEVKELKDPEGAKLVG